jgi:chemotaxis protein CheX
MSARDLASGDIEVFSEAVRAYFRTTTGEAAEVRSAYLLDSTEPALRNDYNGIIEISGGFVGSVCFSAPRTLLSHVLLAIGERDYTDDKHRDLVGEIANTLSGRARRHFGEQLGISPPRTFGMVSCSLDRRAASAPYAIPLTWNGYAADLVVHLDPAT